jgi:hypothetical protein
VTHLDLETIDYIAIRRLQCAYADCVNRRAWKEFDQLFVEDASITIDTKTIAPMHFVGPTAIGDFIRDAIDGFDLFEFVILNTVVDLAPVETIDSESRTATARIYMCEIRHDRMHGQATTAYGLYQDSYVRTGGRWQIAARLYQSLARTAPDLTILPLPTLL